MPQATRYNFIDVMKLIAMFFVYSVHYSGMGRYGLYFFLLLVPCFFFCSGFTAFRHESDGIFSFIKLKLQKIVWPYFVFCAISLVLRIFVMQMQLSEILEWLRGALYGSRNSVPVAALWFLPCLFFLSIFYHILQKYIKNKYLLLIVCFAISACVKFVREDPVLPWGIDMAGRFMIYYALGDFAHHMLEKFPIKNWNAIAKSMMLAITFVFAVISYFGFYYGLGYIPSLLGISQPTFFMLAAEQFLYIIVGTWCVVALSMLLQNLPFLCNAGKYTLMFCGLEQVIKTLFPLIFGAVGLTVSDAGGTVMLMQAVITMALCYFLLAKPMQKYMPWVTDFKKAVALIKG